MLKDRVHVRSVAAASAQEVVQERWLDRVLLPWQLLLEHWQTVRTSRAMLHRFRVIAHSQPRLVRTEAYLLLVQEHMQCDRRAAERIVLAAGQSFAVWPEERELQLRDVIHYITVTEFLDRRAHVTGMRSDVQSVVNALVPNYL